MRLFAYRAVFEPGETRGATVVSFPDVPQAITQGKNKADARRMAREVLGLALLEYAKRGMKLPVAKAKHGELISLAPELAAKIALIEAMAKSGLGKSEFARKLGKDEKEARRLLDPKHPTRIGTMNEALGVFGKRIVVGIEDEAAA